MRSGPIIMVLTLVFIWATELLDVLLIGEFAENALPNTLPGSFWYVMVFLQAVLFSLLIATIYLGRNSKFSADSWLWVYTLVPGLAVLCFQFSRNDYIAVACMGSFLLANAARTSILRIIADRSRTPFGQLYAIIIVAVLLNIGYIRFVPYNLDLFLALRFLTAICLAILAYLTSSNGHYSTSEVMANSVRRSRPPLARLLWRLLAFLLFRAVAIALVVSLAVAVLVIDRHTGHLRAVAVAVIFAALGALIGGANGNPYRSLGMISLGVTALIAVSFWLSLSESSFSSPVVPFLVALVFTPLGAYVHRKLSYDFSCLQENILNLFAGTVSICLAVLVAELTFLTRVRSVDFESGLPKEAATLILGLVLISGFASSVVLWIWLFIPTLQLVIEWLLSPVYRIREYGPGVGRIPERGPVLIVANHAAWLDPFCIAKVAPCPIRPMMTSRFFDLPVIRWLMVRVVRAIRVENSLIRHETPEIDQAIAGLRAGDCITIFPEGMMRRNDETLLRPFGQGVWRILDASQYTRDRLLDRRLLEKLHFVLQWSAN